MYRRKKKPTICLFLCLFLLSSSANLAGPYQGDPNRSNNHAPHRPGWDGGRSSSPGEPRHATEGGKHRHQAMPQPSLASNGPGGGGGGRQQNHPRHGYRHNQNQHQNPNSNQHLNPNHSQNHPPGAALTPNERRLGRSMSHPATIERGNSRLGPNARGSPVAPMGSGPGPGQGTPSRGSPLTRRGSPMPHALGAGSGQPPPAPSHSSPLARGSHGGSHGSKASPGGAARKGEGGWAGGYGEAGEGAATTATVSAESNGWSGHRRQRGPVVTDRLVALKAEFLELHDMLLESDFQWEESQRFCEVLKLQLDQLMLLPHRHRDSSAPPR